jgi:ubiquinone/menaquinone biosynthesis C-methylase UbiE
MLVLNPMTSFDLNEFKTVQRQSWNNVAEGWKQWWETFEKGAQRLSNRLIELAKIKSGQRVLDIATGIGEPAVSIAKMVGTGGHVLATDISTQMLYIAKQRAASLGLQEIIEFKESDTEKLDLPNSHFDAVLCRWGLMFLPNIDVTINKIYSSLVHQGLFATAVWADAPKVPVISFAVRIIGELVQMAAPQPGTPNPFSLADTKRLENSMVETGFINVQKERVNVTFEFASGEEYSRYCRTVLPPARAALSKETEQRKQDVWKKVSEEAAKNYGTPDGHIRMNNESICVVGTKQ